MTITLNPREFIHNFIDPLSEIDKVGRVSLYNSGGKDIYTVVSTPSGGIHLYNTFSAFEVTDPIDRCSINIQKLCRGLNCIPRDTTMVVLTIDPKKGVCAFSTPDVKFNIRLLDDNMIAVSKFNIETFHKFPFHHEVAVSEAKLAGIKKVMDFCPDNKKFHLIQENKCVYFYFGDKLSTSNHTDDIQILVADDVQTQVPTKIYDIDVLRLILRQRNKFTMKIHDNGVMCIDSVLSNTTQKYITVPLLK